MSWTLSDAWKVLGVYLIPFGGGIPGGVILAKNSNIPWGISMLLYFVSDIILACVFEPLMYAFILMRDKYKFRFVALLSEAFKVSVQKAIAHYGHRTGPIVLILIAFGVDPMTGRAAAKSAGHGFITGWMIAIAGDMIYFSVLMVSTLWLNSLLGDGTLTILIILALMYFAPILIRRIRSRFLSKN